MFLRWFNYMLSHHFPPHIHQRETEGKKKDSSHSTTPKYKNLLNTKY